MTNTNRIRAAGALALAALAALAPGATASTLSVSSSLTPELSLWSTSGSDGGTSGGAQASVADPAADPCAAPTYKAFAAWNDPADYRLTPGGDFESGGAGWVLAGGAAVVSGGSPFAPTGTKGASALSLPAGASATSPVVCMQPGSPVARFFAVTEGGGSSASLRVELLDASGDAKSAGNIPALASWDATRRFSVAQGRVLAAGRSGTAALRVRLIAESGATWRVDDVFVDPRSWG